MGRKKRTSTDQQLFGSWDHWRHFASLQRWSCLSTSEYVYIYIYTTSTIEPSNAGAIAALKILCGSFQMYHAPDLIDVNTSDVYKVEIVEPMWALKRLCIALPATILHNSWKYTRIIQGDGTVARDDLEQFMVADSNRFTNLILELVSECSRIPIPPLLNAPAEKEYVEKQTDEELISHFLLGENNESYKQVTIPPSWKWSHIKERHHATQITKHIVHGQEEPNDLVRDFRAHLQLSIHLARAKTLYQSSSDTLFQLERFAKRELEDLPTCNVCLIAQRPCIPHCSTTQDSTELLFRIPRRAIYKFYRPTYSAIVWNHNRAFR